MGRSELISDMAKYFPTLRGWIAFILAVLAIFLFPFLRPTLLIESGKGTFLAESVTPAVKIEGGFLLVGCLIVTIEAFRRGSRADKVLACFSSLLTIALAVEYLELFVLPVRNGS